MANQQTSKGNPAHTRMSNPKRKSRRESSWARGQARKVERQKVQHAAEIVNRSLRNAGDPTPWEAACIARRQARAAKFTVSSSSGTVRVARSKNGKRAPTRNG